MSVVKVGNCEMFLDDKLISALDVAIKRVKVKNWDYVCVVAGLSGAGKSTLARTIAKYCCPWFDENYIAFTDEEFIKISNESPEYSAIILDESFQSLNTRITMSPAFLRIINHLQIIRQRHLFIILCLPNFFDLSKGVAIFRSSHLFVVYASEEGDRGRFLAFGRDTKRKLYIKGMKYLDYNAERANFYGRFTKNNEIINEDVYEKMKLKHLLAQQSPQLETPKPLLQRDNAIYRLFEEKGWKQKDIADFFGLSIRGIEAIMAKQRKRHNPQPLLLSNNTTSIDNHFQEVVA